MWSTWSTRRSTVGSCDDERMREHADDAAVCRERAQLVVRQVAWCVDEGPAVRMARDDRRLRRGLEHVGEGPLGRVREVEDHSQRGEPADELSAEAGETAVGGLAEAVRERVATIPGERHHAHAELPEDVRNPWVVAQRLDAFEREHEPDSVVEGVQIACRANDHHVVRRLACRAVERLHLRE